MSEHFAHDRSASYILKLSLVCTTFQWAFHVVLASINQTENSGLINFINPYELFALIILADAITWRIRNKIAIVFLIVLSVIIVDGLFKYIGFNQFPGNLLKSIQYFYGVIIVFLGFFLLLKKAKVDVRDLPKMLVSNLVLVIGTVTLAELILANFVFEPKDFFFYNGIELTNAALAIEPFKVRPFGLSLSPQANAFTLASLVVLNYLYHRKFNAICAFGTFCVALTFSGTGLALLLVAGMIFSRHVYIKVIVVLTLLIAALSLTDKLSVEYGLLLIDKFTESTSSILGNFRAEEWMLGSDDPSFNEGTGLTTDWAYLDVLYEFGVIGLLIYIGTYYKIIRYVLPSNDAANKFALILLMMFFNLHYPSLNYYVCQMALGILAAMNVYSASSKLQQFNRDETGKVVASTKM